MPLAGGRTSPQTGRRVQVTRLRLRSDLRRGFTAQEVFDDAAEVVVEPRAVFADGAAKEIAVGQGMGAVALEVVGLVLQLFGGGVAGVLVVIRLVVVVVRVLGGRLGSGGGEVFGADLGAGSRRR